MKIISAVHTASNQILTKVLPSRAKRMILLSSLFAQICSPKDQIDPRTIHSLNKLMALSHEDQALKFPMHLSKVIWRGDKNTITLYPSDDQLSIEQTIERLVSNIPSWLAYSSLDIIKEDIRQLFNHRAQIAAA